MTMLKIFDSDTEELKQVVITSTTVAIDFKKKVIFIHNECNIAFNKCKQIETANIPLFYVYNKDEIRRID